MPPCASGPVLTVSKPSLKGAAWATAGAGKLNVAAAAPAALAAMNLRRVNLRDIAFLPGLPLWAYALNELIAPIIGKGLSDVKPASARSRAIPSGAGGQWPTASQTV